MKTVWKSLCFALGVGLTAQAAAGPTQFDVHVPMEDKGVSTFYVSGEIQGVGPVEFMVDTGSGYMTINEVTLAKLKKENNARYVKDLTGVLADGSEMVVPVYAIKRMRIGKTCEIDNVEAAVFPGKTRHILGLSALSKASPFIFSVNPAELVLTCGARATT